MLEASIGVPLLIAVPYNSTDQQTPILRSGFTHMPNQLAVGAAWDPAYAQALGTILGQELSSVGINLLLGPNLDVLDTPGHLVSGTRATATYGSDSWWVAENGAAFVQGISEGSSGRVLSIVGHFPGEGGSDRDLNTELATIQRSLGDLQRNELIPFARAVQPDLRLREVESLVQAAGFMTSHIRYSGFLSSRERTPPISLAPQLSEIMALEAFANWRAQGGLLMSSKLIVPSLSDYYGQSGQMALVNRIANDAFQAGNDLLWIAGSGPLVPADNTAPPGSDPLFQPAIPGKARFWLWRLTQQYAGSCTPSCACTSPCMSVLTNGRSWKMPTVCWRNTRPNAWPGCKTRGPDPLVFATGFDPMHSQVLGTNPIQLSQESMDVKAEIVTWIAQDGRHPAAPGR